MTDKRAHIIDTALHLFSERGFEGTSIRHIAEKASVNVAMVNYYFGSKEKLFDKIVEQKSSVTRILLDEISKNNSLSHSKN
jgi:AcrR family transcriptional regulator